MSDKADVASAASRRWLQKALGLAEDAAPFPWQEELLKRFAKADVPRALDIPTGLGKTAVMAIWLVARACGAELPRRLAYVVDRRAVVDQATDVARMLRDLVDQDPFFKKALGLAHSLPISTLRGQHVDNKEWLEDPASPAIIVGTVDMIGSRLLFEGYGISRKMRPYNAGLLGIDTLVVLDEAHLVPPFEKLLDSIASGRKLFGPREEVLRRLVPPFRLISLSATGRTASSETFGLTEADFKEGSVARKRLDASKHLLILSLGGNKKLADELAAQAWELSDNGRRAVRCIVFCDRREDAANAKKAIEKLARKNKKRGVAMPLIDTELFVGGRRVFERETAANRLRDLGFIARTKVAPARPAFVFATSAGEVGVDLDADHMVSDLVAWERMVQRLGRVNRRGHYESRVVVIREPAPVPSKVQKEALEKEQAVRTKKEADSAAQYEALLERWRALARPFEYLPKDDHGVHDASPGALLRLSQRVKSDQELKRVLEAATTPEPLRPALSRPLLDAWSMTSLKEHAGRPEVQPWLRGWIEGDPPQTTVVWRTHLPVRSKGGEATDKEIEAFFEAAPPHASERLETETFRVIECLSARAKALNDASFHQRASTPQASGSGGNKPLRGTDVVAVVLGSSGDLRRILSLEDLLLNGKDKRAEDRRKTELEQVLPGATVILDAHLGGLQDGLLDSPASDPPRTADDGQPWNPGDPQNTSEEPSTLSAPAVTFRVRTAGAQELPVPDDHWRERYRFATDLSPDGEPTHWLIVEKWRSDAATEDDRSTARHAQPLADHQAWVEDRAIKLGHRLGLPEDLVKTFGIAARLHDNGKRARRWQRAFNARSDQIYAKTRGPVNPSLLDGYRHELGSLLSAESSEALRALPTDLQDLALHLIVVHHGFARPVISISGCEDSPPSLLEEQAEKIAIRFARLQKRWGPWGLAWCESLLRAADQQASRDHDAARSNHAGEEG